MSLDAKPAPSISYRPEIDGLRAIAVLGVLFFHVNFGISGGFVGVDVFFVISGYLITSIVANDLKSNTFTFYRFWTKRIKRILPASSAMTGVVALAGFLILLPGDFESLMRSAMWHTGIAANIFFAQDTGYFSEQSELKPLLHTWSLSVEEQFYLVFPVLLYLVFRGRRRAMPFLLLSLTISSFAFSVWRTQHDPTAAFFLLPSRAWELLIGSLVAVCPAAPRSKALAEATCLAGALLIFCSMIFYDNDTTFPGFAALPPVAGTAAVIVGAKNQPTAVANILSCGAMTLVGRMSYSIYLWHWPLISFAHLILIDVDAFVRAGLVVATFVVAGFFYCWVEQPFRVNRRFSQPKNAFRFAFATSACLFCACAVVLKTDGFRNRMSKEEEGLMDDVSLSSWEYESANRDRVLLGEDIDARGGIDFVLWGDSHARTVAGAFSEAAEEIGLTGEAFAYSGQVPIPNLGGTTKQMKEAMALRTQDHVLRRIIEQRVRSVIMVARWSVYCSGRSEAETSSGEKQYETLVGDELTEGELTPKYAAEAMRRQLNDLLSTLRDNGIEVWIVKQVPECNSVAPARNFLKAYYYPYFNRKTFFTLAATRMEDHAVRQALANSLFESIDGAGVHIVDPATGCFDNNGMLRVCSARSHFRDNDHLTHFGAQVLLGELIESILLQVREGDGEDAFIRTPKSL